MPLTHTKTDIEQLTKNILYAIRKSDITLGEVAVKLGIHSVTLSRRIDDAGKFTYADLDVIATITATPLRDLIPLPKQDAA